jgi:hypothetical protein
MISLVFIYPSVIPQSRRSLPRFELSIHKWQREPLEDNGEEPVSGAEVRVRATRY